MGVFCVFTILMLAITLSSTSGEQTKRNGPFDEFALAEYLFRQADINKDHVLTKNEIYNFYRYAIKWPYDKAANMSLKLMNIGDENKDEKLDEIEAILALSKVTEQLTRKQ